MCVNNFGVARGLVQTRLSSKLQGSRTRPKYEKILTIIPVSDPLHGVITSGYVRYAGMSGQLHAGKYAT